MVADSPERLQIAEDVWSEELQRRNLRINARKSKVMDVGREMQYIQIVSSGQLVSLVLHLAMMVESIRRNSIEFKR